ncbi:MAG: hypothetical protein E5W01_12150, partial [Mesorhizobium sp.]
MQVEVGQRRGVAGLGHGKCDIGWNAGPLAPACPGNIQPGIGQIRRNGLVARAALVDRNLDGSGKQRRQARHGGCTHLVVEHQRHFPAAWWSAIPERLDQVEFGWNAVEQRLGGDHGLLGFDGDRTVGVGYGLVLERLAQRQVFV